MVAGGSGDGVSVALVTAGAASSGGLAGGTVFRPTAGVRGLGSGGGGEEASVAGGGVAWLGMGETVRGFFLAGAMSL